METALWDFDQNFRHLQQCMCLLSCGLFLPNGWYLQSYHLCYRNVLHWWRQRVLSLSHRVVLRKRYYDYMCLRDVSTRYRSVHMFYVHCGVLLQQWCSNYMR